MLREKRTNQSILEQCNMKSVKVSVRYRRLRWLGHLARMEDNQLPKQLLFGTMQPQADTEIITGRSRKIWSDYVRQDLITLKVPFTWYRLAQDREKWSDLIRTILEHT